MGSKSLATISDSWILRLFLAASTLQIDKMGSGVSKCLEPIKEFLTIYKPPYYVLFFATIITTDDDQN